MEKKQLEATPPLTAEERLANYGKDNLAACTPAQRRRVMKKQNKHK